MIRYYRAVRGTACRIAEAMERSVQALQSGRVEHEPALTDRMLGAVEDRLRDFSTNGISWSAKTLTDRGPRSQEATYGADFMGVLNVNLPEIQISKGFLAQAKLIRDDGYLDIERLGEQCRKMLALSPDSFVFFYSYAGTRARDHLLVTSVEPASEFLDDLRR
jgi:hypothetical protein